ncbi:hypothetical protein NKZ03_00255 [Sinorhizobium meliloti]|uniref:hypothetical protein n=1 Tax=Rhizobium meliloti TaxID=382 RepID=UPI00299E77FC
MGESATDGRVEYGRQNLIDVGVFASKRLGDLLISMGGIIQPITDESAHLAEIAQDQVPDRRLTGRYIEVVHSLVEERIGDGREAGKVIGGGGDHPAETTIGRPRIAVAYEGFEGVGGAFERLAGQFRRASLSAQRHRTSKQRKAVLCKIGLDRQAERRRIGRQDAFLAHQRPGCAAIEETPKDAVDSCGFQKRGQLVNRLQDLPPPGTSPR